MPGPGGIIHRHQTFEFMCNLHRQGYGANLRKISSHSSFLPGIGSAIVHNTNAVHPVAG